MCVPSGWGNLMYPEGPVSEDLTASIQSTSPDQGKRCAYDFVSEGLNLIVQVHLGSDKVRELKPPLVGVVFVLFLSADLGHHGRSGGCDLTSFLR